MLRGSESEGSLAVIIDKVLNIDRTSVLTAFVKEWIDHILMAISMPTPKKLNRILSVNCLTPSRLGSDTCYQLKIRQLGLGR